MATLAASVAGRFNKCNSTGNIISTADSRHQASEGWNSSATQELTATWANANNMRFFFNAGGKIRITVGATAGRSRHQPKTTSYIDLGAALGNLDIAFTYVNEIGIR